MKKEGIGVMYRDFSEKSKQNLIGLTNEVENEKLSNFTDWIGDRWYDFESWIGLLNIRNYTDNINLYHKKVIDKNNATKKSIEKIFSAVKGLDNTYYAVYNNIQENLTLCLNYIIQLSEIVSPVNGKFSTEYMAARLTQILKNINKKQLDCLRDEMIQDINGELVFDEELIYEYMKKSPAELSDAEQALLLEVISQLKDTVAIYETLASVGTDELGADILNYVSWLANSTEYESFTAVSAHYNDIYVNLLNYMSEQSKDANTFAASLINIGVGESVVSILGVENYENLKDIFGSDSFNGYVAKYVSEHSSQYFAKLEISENNTLKSSGKIGKLNDYIDEMLEKKNFRDKAKDTMYLDSEGNEIAKDDAPTFYKRQISLLEIKKKLEAKASLYEGEFDLGDWGELDVVVGEAEAHGSISAGLYVIGADGEKKFSPGVDAEIGASVTGLDVGWEKQLLGNENFGLNTDAGITVGRAEAKANATVQVFGDDGKLDLQAGVGAKAEAIAAEAEGSVGVNVLGGEVGLKGSVNIGIGAHADAGYRDGVLKLDIGASVGVGASVSVEVDVGGMVDTVCDVAEAAWDGIKNGWNSFMSWW